MSNQTSNDVGTLTIGGTSFLQVFEDVQWSCDPEFDDWQNPTRLRKGSQPMKNAARLEVPLKPVKTGSVRLSHFDLTALSLAGISLLDEYESLEFRVTNPISPLPNGGEFKRRFQVDPGGTLEATINTELQSENSEIVDLLALLESDDPDDLAAILSMTLNAVAITAPGNLRRGTHNAGGRQKATIQWEGSDNEATYPTAPTGTSTILERAINAPKTPLAFSYVSKLVEGLERSGNLLIASGMVRIPSDKLVQETWSFVVSEPWTTEVTTAE